MSQVRSWAGVYIPMTQLPPKAFANWTREVSILARADGDPLALESGVRTIVASMDKRQPVRDLRTMQELVEEKGFRSPRFNTLLLVSFGGLALLLAMVEIYGAFHYWVIQRTRELGIRISLGARRRDVVALILRQGLRLVLPGMAFGFTCAVLLVKMLESMLFEVKPYNPLIWLTVALSLFGAAMFACYLPARRAAGIDPMNALRLE